MITDFLPHISSTFDWIVLSGAVVIALVTLHKYVVKRMIGVYKKFDRAASSMLGYEEITDKATGRILQERTPSMAHRVWDLEQSMTKIANAMEIIAKTQRDMLTLTDRVAVIEDNLQKHDQWAQNWMRDHETLHNITAEVKAAIKPDKP